MPPACTSTRLPHLRPNPRRVVAVEVLRLELGDQVLPGHRQLDLVGRPIGHLDPLEVVSRPALETGADLGDAMRCGSS
jgi:hypothetical protein